MDIKISESFGYKKLIRFTMPSIVMMIFTSIYGVVDGFFVSNYAGKTAFAAVNFIMPYLMILGAIGFMFGAGGSAIIAKTMGEGDYPRANRYFSFLIYCSLVISILIAIGGIFLLHPVAALFGARGAMLESCVTYGRIILFALPAFILQMEFQSFFITAEKPSLGLAMTLIAGFANILLDFLLVGVFSFGLVGAAVATAVSQLIGGFAPLLYFALPNKSSLRLSKTEFNLPVLIKTFTNGSSELMSNISMSLVGMLYNIQLLKYAGENGVAAYGVMMYINMIFIAVFIGFSVGSAPIVSYHFGAGNKDELKSLLRKSSSIIAFSSVVMLISALALSKPLSVLFVGYDAELTSFTSHGFYIFSISFLFCGFAIFGSSFFTALNDGITSAIISFMRTLVFQVLAVILLPLAFGINGIWLSIVIAEASAAGLLLFFILKKKKKYDYL